MNELLKVVDEYKIFNYLVPGVLAAYLIGDGSFFGKIQAVNLFVAFFIYYFIGLLCSRLGSLVIEPALKATHLIRFADYSDFMKAEKKDEKIASLSQENNTFRTYIAVLSLVLIVNMTRRLSATSALNFRESSELLAIAGGALLLMVLSYRKQTTYIARRVEHNLKYTAQNREKSKSS